MNEEEHEEFASCDAVCDRNLGICNARKMVQFVTSKLQDVAGLGVPGLTCLVKIVSSHWDVMPYVTEFGECAIRIETPEEATHMDCSARAPDGGGRRLCACRTAQDFELRKQQACSGTMADTDVDWPGSVTDCAHHCR